MDCSRTITITSQDDIDHSLASCNGSGLGIEIRNATGILNFTATTTAGLISIQDCPQLWKLDLSQLVQLDVLNIAHAETLEWISLSKLVSKAYTEVTEHGLVVGGIRKPTSIYITGALKLDEIVGPSITGFHNLTLLDSANGTLPVGFRGITSVVSLISNSPIYVSGLQLARSLDYSNSKVGPDLSALTSVDNLTLRNGAGVYNSTNPIPDLPGTTLMINDTFTLDSAVTEYSSRASYGNIVSIQNLASITSNENLDIDLSKLTTVGSSISVQNNTNCTIDFSSLTSSTNISVIDNADTVLPLLYKLESADNIHLRGNISTEGGPNIFPALNLVSGSVTVEAWNEDFDCSKLVSQWHDNIIHTLSCNGTNGTRDTAQEPTSPSPPSSQGLSVGAGAGIGVGIAVAVIGAIIVTIFWTRLHYKRKLRAASEKSTEPSAPPSQREGLWASALVELREKEGRGIAREKPDDHICEMPVPPTELATTSLTTTRAALDRTKITELSGSRAISSD
ncbi:hypothetical protein F4777DRAFT_115765 [Nemania sp. FL0916]|nr:hypothetical protein F4777DRAFT_115765 [Nemania sp. FL0916]